MKKAFAIPMFCAMLAVGTAHAGKSNDVIKADTREAFAPVAADVLKEMNPGGRYGELQAAQQASRKFMDERLNTPCNAPSCAGN